MATKQFVFGDGPDRDRSVKTFETIYALFMLGAMVAAQEREKTFRNARMEADLLDALDAISEPHPDNTIKTPTGEEMRTLAAGPQRLELTSALVDMVVKYIEKALPAVVPSLVRHGVHAIDWLKASEVAR